MRILFCILMFLLTISLVTANPDPYAKEFNFTYITSVFGVTLNYTNISDPFAQGDAILIQARIQGTDPTQAIPYYQQALQTAHPEEQAILWESIASI